MLHLLPAKIIYDYSYERIEQQLYPTSKFQPGVLRHSFLPAAASTGHIVKGCLDHVYTLVANLKSDAFDFCLAISV